MGTDVFVAALSSGSSSKAWLVYLMFIISGLFVGGTWSAYQNKSRFFTVMFALIAAVAFLSGVLWLMGELG